MVRVCLVALALVFAASTASTASAGLPQAIQASKASGRPLLLLASSDSCPHCVALKRDLATNPAIAKTVQASFIPVEVKQGTAEWNLLAQNYQVKQGVPQLFIIASNGQQLAHLLGRPQGEGLAKFLKEGVEKAQQQVKQAEAGKAENE